MRNISALRQVIISSVAICNLWAPVRSNAQQTAQSTPPVYAITHAKIITIAASPIADGTLVIKDGKIAAVGASVEVPAGAQIIDGKGLQVYPGLFDPVTQMGLSEIGAVSATVDSSETDAYNPDVIAATAVLPESLAGKLRHSILVAGRWRRCRSSVASLWC